jgi:16S rRNA (guanine527-N7)-methyltransferase
MPPVPAWFAEILELELRPWIILSDDQISKLYTHYGFLERWNEKISLTSVEPGREMVIRHYCESLFLAAHLSTPATATIADLGSGAGFPGVPVAVFLPEGRVALIESVQRKAVFLREATRHLSNVSVIARRAEEMELGFDLLISRAVNPKEVMANLPRLANSVALLVGESGLDELRGARGIAWSEPIRLPWGDRRFLVMGSVPRGTTS